MSNDALIAIVVLFPMWVSWPFDLTVYIEAQQAYINSTELSFLTAPSDTILLLVDTGRAMSGSESDSELPLLNLVPVNVR